jgi:hypothetical protein
VRSTALALLFGLVLSLAACQHGPIHAGNQWHPLDQHHYSIADLPSGELMPPGWTPGIVVRPFLQPDFAFSRAPDSWIVVETIFLTQPERRLDLLQLSRQYGSLITAIGMSVANVTYPQDTKMRTAGPPLPFEGAPEDTAEHLVLLDNPRLIVYGAIRRGYGDELILVIAGSKSADPAIEEARSLLLRLHPDPAK